MDGTEQRQFVNTLILLVRFIVVFNSNVSCLMLLVLHLIIHKLCNTIHSICYLYNLHAHIVKVH